MPTNRALITTIYAAFNNRDIDAALALMSDHVHWPKASEGGHVIGKEEIRAYWTRQWSQFDPHVEPLEIIERTATQPDIITTAKTDVRVHQIVKSLTGELLLSDSEVWHTFTLSNGLIDRMDIKENDLNEENSGEGSATPSAAFSRH